jgi:hypothetical protein
MAGRFARVDDRPGKASSAFLGSEGAGAEGGGGPGALIDFFFNLLFRRLLRANGMRIIDGRSVALTRYLLYLYFLFPLSLSLSLSVFFCYPPTTSFFHRTF